MTRGRLRTMSLTRNSLPKSGDVEGRGDDGGVGSRPLGHAGQKGGQRRDRQQPGRAPNLAAGIYIQPIYPQVQCF